MYSPERSRNASAYLGLPPTPPQAMEMYNQVNQETHVAMAFRERLIPDAVLWFTGEAEDDDEEDEDDEEGEEEEESGSEEEEEEAPKKGKKSDKKVDAALAQAFAKKASVSGGAAVPEASAAPAPECKTQ